MTASPDDPELGDSLRPNDPRRRALRGGGKLRGEALRAEIRQQAEEGSGPSEIAKRCRVSRQLVHRVLTAPESEKRQRISDDLLAKMTAALRAGHSPAELVDQLPEIAAIFKARADEAPAALRERVLQSLRQLISAGGRADSGPARALYEARQAGRLGATTPAEESPPPSKPRKPKQPAK